MKFQQIFPAFFYDIHDDHAASKRRLFKCRQTDANVLLLRADPCGDRTIIKKILHLSGCRSPSPKYGEYAAFTAFAAHRLNGAEFAIKPIARQLLFGRSDCTGLGFANPAVSRTQAAAAHDAPQRRPASLRAEALEEEGFHPAPVDREKEFALDFSNLLRQAVVASALASAKRRKRCAAGLRDAKAFLASSGCRLNFFELVSAAFRRSLQNRFRTNKAASCTLYFFRQRPCARQAQADDRRKCRQASQRAFRKFPSRLPASRSSTQCAWDAAARAIASNNAALCRSDRRHRCSQSGSARTKNRRFSASIPNGDASAAWRPNRRSRS